MFYDRIALERHDFSATRAERLQNAKHWILRLNADGPQKPPCENRWMAAGLWLSRFLKHLFGLEEHDLSFRCAVLWSSTGILLNDKARDWSKVAISFLGCCRTPLVLHDSEVLQNSCKSSKISVWFISSSNCCDSSLNLLISCFSLMSSRKWSLCCCFSNISLFLVTLFCRCASCSFTVEIDIPSTRQSAVLLLVSPQLSTSCSDSQDDLASCTSRSCEPLCELALRTTRGLRITLSFW